ncbi:hypothetical protein [Spirosoma sordidisoli]|uniref:Uncharacterized protein n=1 Tax=Spirosoma sordidisoli TaxID=2502893 RepID=A0A4V1RWL4_9BACT|nr:hypothetical protein [Spirosoma sordidisoli]RYC70678.1 hypothetical protein EQG79_00570 [Spirosoma sordidisoli]
MVPVASGNANLIGAVTAPFTNWSAASAARQEAVQVGAIANQQSEQQLAEEQQGEALTQQFLQKARSLPFLGKDRQRLQAYVNAEEKALYRKLLTEYNGNFRAFAKAELPTWQADSASRLQQQPWYAQATENVRNVLAAQEAANKSEFLVGNGDLKNFRSGEKELEGFLTGQSDVYKFRGSYKPDDDLKEIRDQYAPGRLPWERVAVGEDEKLNRLVDKYGREMGVDKYLRQHAGTQVYYKTDPITKAYEFQMDQGRYQMAVNDDKRSQARLGMEGQRLGLAFDANRRAAAGFKTDQALKGQAYQLNQIKIAKGLQDLSGKSADGKGYDYKLFGEGAAPADRIRLNPDAEGSKVLPFSKVDLSKVGQLQGATLFGELGDVLLKQLGIQKTKTGFSKGNIQEGFIDANGVQPINLKGLNFQVMAVEPKVFIDPKSMNPAKGALNRDTRGYSRVTVQFNDPTEARKAGLFDNWTGFGPTKAGTGVYNPSTRQATIFVPIGAVDEATNPNFVNALIKAQQGQKRANDEWDSPSIPTPYTDTTF